VNNTNRMTTKSFLLYSRNKAPEDDSLRAGMYGSKVNI